MITFNSVPTTCTAKLLTGWGLNSNLISDVEKVKLKAQLEILKEMDSQSPSHSTYKFKYLQDFAIVHVFITHQQMQYNEEVLKLMGFNMVFQGRKDHDKKQQREQNTGHLYLWATDPYTWKSSTEASIKAIEERLAIIDPPKKPDPARQKWPALRGLKGVVVQNNSILRNKVCDVLVMNPNAAAIYIRNNFGFDPREWKNRGEQWTNLTIDGLRKEHEAWKAELV